MFFKLFLYRFGAFFAVGKFPLALFTPALIPLGKTFGQPHCGPHFTPFTKVENSENDRALIHILVPIFIFLISSRRFQELHHLFLKVLAFSAKVSYSAKSTTLSSPYFTNLIFVLFSLVFLTSSQVSFARFFNAVLVQIGSLLPK